MDIYLPTAESSTIGVDQECGVYVVMWRRGATEGWASVWTSHHNGACTFRPFIPVVKEGMDAFSAYHFGFIYFEANYFSYLRP
jgi:hypothetical protein